MYYKSRLYSTAFGRFISRDPIGYTDGQNLYLYPGDNPTDLIDPYGLFLRVLDEGFHDDSKLSLGKPFCGDPYGWSNYFKLLDIHPGQEPSAGAAFGTFVQWGVWLQQVHVSWKCELCTGGTGGSADFSY